MTMTMTMTGVYQETKKTLLILMGDPPQECGRRQSQSGSNETGDTQRFLPGVDKIRKYPKHTKMMNNLKEWF